MDDISSIYTIQQQISRLSSYSVFSDYSKIYRDIWNSCCHTDQFDYTAYLNTLVTLVQMVPKESKYKPFDESVSLEKALLKQFEELYTQNQGIQIPMLFVQLIQQYMKLFYLNSALILFLCTTMQDLYKKCVLNESNLNVLSEEDKNQINSVC